ncbi:hypothetical protein HDK77DRAFT_252456 [Phyllosticta capitalensis]
MPWRPYRQVTGASSVTPQALAPVELFFRSLPLALDKYLAVREDLGPHILFCQNSEHSAAGMRIHSSAQPHSKYSRLFHHTGQRRWSHKYASIVLLPLRRHILLRFESFSADDLNRFWPVALQHSRRFRCGSARLLLRAVFAIRRPTNGRTLWLFCVRERRGQLLLKPKETVSRRRCSNKVEGDVAPRLKNEDRVCPVWTRCGVSWLNARWQGADDESPPGVVLLLDDHIFTPPSDKQQASRSGNNVKAVSPSLSLISHHTKTALRRLVQIEKAFEQEERALQTIGRLRPYRQVHPHLYSRTRRQAFSSFVLPTAISPRYASASEPKAPYDEDGNSEISSRSTTTSPSYAPDKRCDEGVRQPISPADPRLDEPHKRKVLHMLAGR